MIKNIYQRKDGRYEARISLGKDSTGKRIYRSFYGRTVSEVEQKLSTIGEYTFAITEMTVKEIALEYLAAIKPRLKESTWVNYRMKTEKHIIPAFGNMPCYKFCTNHIYEFMDSKKQQGLSQRYIADIIVLVKSIFRYTQRIHNIKNPLDDFKMPKVSKNDVTVLSELEQKRLLCHVHDRFEYLGIMISLYTGMRIGEICALQWADVDFNNNIIHVRRTLQRIQNAGFGKNSKIVITEPKSASSVRDIPIPDCLMQLLTKYRNHDDVFVISGKRKPIECRTLQYRFSKVLNNANLPSVHFHSLRHAFATNCIALGFDVKTLSEILGHSRIEITMNRYVHSSIERKRACMSLLTWVA